MKPDDDLVIPLTAIIVDRDGRLTYMGSDGLRRIILGSADLFRALQSRDDFKT